MGSGYLGGGPYLPYFKTSVDLTLTDEHYTVACDSSTATITLPPSNNVGIGRIYCIKSIGLSEAAFQISCSGTDHLDGGTGTTLTSYQAIIVQSNGAGTWYTIATT